jgi:hypothetical protein
MAIKTKIEDMEIGDIIRIKGCDMRLEGIITDVIRQYCKISYIKVMYEGKEFKINCDIPNNAIELYIGNKIEFTCSGIKNGYPVSPVFIQKIEVFDINKL